MEDYILGSISWENYTNEPKPFVEDKLSFLRQTFMNEYGWNVKQVGQYEALVSWLSGLPSAINIAFYNCDIIKLGNQWGLLKENATDSQEHQFCTKWFRLLAMRILHLWNTHKI